MENNFLPGGYEAPKTQSLYFKPKSGDNKVRILSNPILGWIDWTEDKKPIRTPYKGMSSEPRPINPKRPVKHFWAMVVWDYSDAKIKVWEATQATIHNALFTLSMDEAWGNPTGYDLNVKKTGEDLETKYEVIPRPPKPLEDDIKAEFEKATINLDALMENGNPFSNEKTEKKKEEKGEVVDVDDVPFDEINPFENDN